MESAEQHQRRVRWELIILVIMCFGYLSAMLCRNAIIVASPAMIEDPTLAMDEADYGRIMAWHSIGGVVGKLASGIAVDRMGGRLMFILMLVITALATSLFGVVNRISGFAFLNFTAQGFKSGGWPAMASLIRNWYRPSRHGTVWSVLSISSRSGVLASTFFLGYLLTRLSWHWLFWVAALVGFAAAATAFFFLKAKPQDLDLPPPQDDTELVEPEAERAPHPLDQKSIGQAMLIFALSPLCWLICLSQSMLQILMDFLNFIPLYLTDSLQLTPGQAGMAGSILPAGCLAALVLAGFTYDRLTKSQRIAYFSVQLSIAAFCCFILLKLPGWEFGGRATFGVVMVAVFLFGMCSAPAYYLPMGVFSISFGGAHCGLLIAIIDIFGYAGASVFNYYGGTIIKEQGWASFLTLLIVISVVACLLLSSFLTLDWKQSRGQS